MPYRAEALPLQWYAAERSGEMIGSASNARTIDAKPNATTTVLVSEL